MKTDLTGSYEYEAGDHFIVAEVRIAYLVTLIYEDENAPPHSYFMIEGRLRETMIEDKWRRFGEERQEPEPEPPLYVPPPPVRLKRPEAKIRTRERVPGATYYDTVQKWVRFKTKYETWTLWHRVLYTMPNDEYSFTLWKYVCGNGRVVYDNRVTVMEERDYVPQGADVCRFCAKKHVIPAPPYGDDVANQGESKS